MRLEVKNIAKSLAPAFRASKPMRDDIEAFRRRLATYLNNIDKGESEENLKTHFMDLLKGQFGKSYLIEQQERIDLIIRTGKKNTPAGVLFEVKRSSNAAEMITADNLNKRALHELVLYFMQERHKGNTDIKYLVICTEIDVYIFEAQQFEREFYQNTAFKKDFIAWQGGQKTDSTTAFFYNHIAKPFIADNDSDLTATHFAFKNTIENYSDKELARLFKVLSPQHLLKVPFANDSNSLNTAFYDELLHIIGLSEEKEGGKKVIKRCAPTKRKPASLIENTIAKLKREDDFHTETKLIQYGTNADVRAFNMALELCITWVNRILFLKLLEAQIVSYHQGNPDYRFLNNKMVQDYDELADLFFGVLALKQPEREDHIQQKYSHVPYLNSALFDKTDLEKMLGISQLNHSFELPLFNRTVLKNDKNKAKYSKLKTLDYLFEFLDAYDFSSEGGADIQEDGKTIINAAVLGLIFEKINGYKEGAIFTPGYITMYMSEKVIAKTVLEKFQAAYPDWQCTTLKELRSYLLTQPNAENLKAYNAIINSIKICDPAVGSGHFLVSCLNEMIAIKSRLGILCNASGDRVTDYDIQVDNDELIITHTTTNEVFAYQLQDGVATKQLQAMQETLFVEKQTIIENCLFGVDINANSVKICQLRLWIELLKNAFYKVPDFEHLETLPNIDINIKCGNSLLSRYKLDDSLSSAFKNANLTVAGYRQLVNDYKNTKDKFKKRQLLENIAKVKARFKEDILGGVTGEINKRIKALQATQAQQDLFVADAATQKNQRKKLKSLEADIQKLKDRKEAYATNNTFLNALEWRFEFPEVLDNKGKFLGFDIVIANPPYMRVQEIEKTQPLQKEIYEDRYLTAKGSYDLANLFFELAGTLAAPTCNNIYIFPHKLFNSDNGSSLREYLLNSQTIKHISHFGANMVFDNAITYTCIALFNNQPSSGFDFQRFKLSPEFKQALTNHENYQYLHYADIEKASKLYGNNQWIFFDNPKGFEVFEKIYQQPSSVEQKFAKVFQGIPTSKDTLYVVHKLAENDQTYTIQVNPKNKAETPAIESKIFEVEKTLFKPFLMGKDVHAYQTLKTDKLVFFPYLLDGKAKLINEADLQAQFPLTHQYVMHYENVFKARESGKAEKAPEWYAYLRVQNLDSFEQQKLSSMEICATQPNVTLNNDNLYHTTKVYSWVKAENNQQDYAYYLAILNSTLIWWFLMHTGDTLQHDSRTMKTNYLNPFPLPNQIPPETETRIAGMVTQLMTLKQSNPLADDVPILEKQINQAVYDLYGLDDADIQVIEESLAPAEPIKDAVL